MLALIKRIKKELKMKDLILNKIPAFGFESEHIYSKHRCQVGLANDVKKWPSSSKEIMISNALKIAMYIPVLGIFLGGLMTFAAYKAHLSTYANIKPLPWAVRGVISILGLGIIFLPLDVAMTGKRKIQQLLLK